MTDTPHPTSELDETTMTNLMGVLHGTPDREPITDPDPRSNTTYRLGDITVLNVTCTDEGVIMDLYRDDDLVATVGMTADEWANWIEEQRR